METSIASLSSHGDEIRPYHIHVSSRYLDLTKKKLELTRLPHELLLPAAREWEHGTPKSEIEPLIDFWLEKYSWRSRESHLNSILPQFRTAIKANGGPPLRIHFLHIRSQHTHAIPLLLIPSFPLTNLSLPPALWKPLLEPTDGHAFHIVVPSIPGLGFSDSFPTATGVLENTAAIFNTLMQRLGYEYYLASSTGSGQESPAQIDYHLGRLLGEKFPGSCLGVHLIAPPLRAPRFGTETWAWVKFAIARFFHASIFGYQSQDFIALHYSHLAARKKKKNPWRSESTIPVLAPGQGKGFGVIGMLGLREPNTLAYAICDSPVGLLSLVCSALRRRSPSHRLSKSDVVDVATLAWLPGPEAALRFWAGAVGEVQERKLGRVRKNTKVAVTVFGVDGIGVSAEEGDYPYVCPAWGQQRFDVVFSQRVEGRTGLVAWERGDAVVQGVRGLAKEVEKRDLRLLIRELQEVVVAYGDETILEEVEPEQKDNEEDEEDEASYEMQLDVESTDTVVAVTLS